MRPLRGRQGTFDKIIDNVRRVAHKVPITIGGNFDESSADSYPALLDFLREQEFADKIVKINFKPIIKAPDTTPKGVIPLTVVGGGDKPLNGTCMTSAGAGSTKGSSVCDSCHFVDEKMAFLRERDPEARASRHPTAFTWAPARYTVVTRTRLAPMGRCTRVRASPDRKPNRPVTSTGG